MNDSVAYLKEQARKDRAHLAAHIDARCIAILERKFSTRQAAFLRTPTGYDPLDAMRRDAYREVVCWLKSQLALAKKESQER